MKAKKRNDFMSQLRLRIDETFRKAETILKQSKGPSYAAEYDLVKSMKGRRKEALRKTWDDFVDSNAEEEWMMLNLFSRGINRLESEGYILFAASIWILDTLNENRTIRKVYPLFPSDLDLFENEIMTLEIPDAWDSHFEFEMIAGVEYILYKRNSDKGIPRYLSGRDNEQILITTDDAVCNNNNTRNRKFFNELMNLIPSEKKELAAKHFKEVFQIWVKSFFDCINCICKPVNTAIRLAAKPYQIEEIQEKVLNFIVSVNNSGLYEPEVFIDLYGTEDIKNAKPLPPFDPFELCFGLLYLIEQDNDLPWLIGACRGVMTEVIRRLPWGISKSKESRSIYSKRIKDTNTDSTKLLLPFDRVFHEGNDETAVNLMQIIYQETGCLLPRNIQNDQYISRLIEKYNIDQQAAQVIHYCSILLMNGANFIEEPFDDYITEKTKDHTNTVSELKEMNEKASKEFKGLRSEFQKIKKQLDNTTKELEGLKRKEQSELRELADLREIIFKDKNNIEDDTTVNEKEFPYTVTHKTIIFGGHEAWVNELKNKLKGEIRYVSADLIFDKDIVKNCEMLWIQTNVMSHNCFDRIKDASIKHGVPIRYFTYNGSKLCAKQLREYDIALNKV